MEQALDAILKLRQRAQHVAVAGNREYNPGWHTALDLNNLLTVSEAITRAALQRKESRGAHFRDDYPEKDETFGSFNLWCAKATTAKCRYSREPLVPLRDELETGDRGDEVMATATFRIWRGDPSGGQFRDYTTEISEGMVVLDAVHHIQANRPTIWPSAGTARRANAVPARRKSTACPS